MTARSAIVVICNPENRRAELFQQALARTGQPPARLVSYLDLIAGRVQLSEVVRPGCLVRLESPGENFHVEKAILAAGAADAEAEGSARLAADRVRQLEFDRGLILHPRQWYLGYRALLRKWHAELREIGDVRMMNSPADIEVMFDKRCCHAFCQKAGVPVPRSLPEIGSYHQLRSAMAATGLHRVFVKLAHGSSASGVVAVYRHRDQLEAVTSAEIVRTRGHVRLYNSLRLRRYTDLQDLRDLIDALARERVHVEQWLPKASLAHGTTFDLRIVVVGGEATHIVVRQARGPLTNLHLGNRRGDADHLFRRLGPERVEQVRATCRDAAAVFPNTLYAGLDLLLTPGLRSHFLLEINAFGDLLPDILHLGLDTYSYELARLDCLVSSRAIAS